MREHRFSIGQSVRMANRLGTVKTDELFFTVTGKMPEKDSSPQYRIRSDEERHERVVSEDMLQAIAQELEIVEAAEQLFAPQEKRRCPSEINQFPKTLQQTSEVRIHMQVLVRDNNVDQALRVLKKKMQREGIIREMKASAAPTRNHRKSACAKRPRL